MGRFINADSYVSTGQGILGNNMFVYCANNPIIYYDTTGNYYLPIHDKFAHDAVLSELCGINQDLRCRFTCVKYCDNKGNFTGKWGFCDLYNHETGEVWELKKDSSSRTCTTAYANNQLDKYIHGRLLWQPDLKLKRPTETIITTGHIRREYGDWIFHIDYWNEGNGILRYTYTKELNTTKLMATAAIAITLVGCALAPELLGGLLTGIGAGALLPA